MRFHHIALSGLFFLVYVVILFHPKEAGARAPIHLSKSYTELRYYNVGVLMASNLNSPFDLERCGPAVDMALEEINDRLLSRHGVILRKVQRSYPSCSGALAPGIAADMHFLSDVVAFIGPACLFALEPVARLAAYWNTPIITGMGDQQKVLVVNHSPPPPSQPVITSERLPQPATGTLSEIIEGPPHRAVSFHERATSKDVIEELNRMIRNGDENEVPPKAQVDEPPETNGRGLDKACRPTGWVHVERDVDLTDPKARANLLDVMLASVSSDSSPTSSCGGSVASDSMEDPHPDYGQLHRIHKYHRQKKASASAPCTPLTETTV